MDVSDVMGSLFAVLNVIYDLVIILEMTDYYGEVIPEKTESIARRV